MPALPVDFFRAIVELPGIDRIRGFALQQTPIRFDPNHLTC